MGTFHVKNFSEQFERLLFGTNLKCFKHSELSKVFNTILLGTFCVNYFSAQSEMFPNKSEMFRNTLKCSQTKSRMFRSFFKCANVPVQFWNIFPNIYEIFYKYIWNILKQSEMFPNKHEIFLNHSKHYKVFNTIYWVLFMQTLRCSQTNLNVSKHSKMFPNIPGLFLLI